MGTKRRGGKKGKFCYPLIDFLSAFLKNELVANRIDFGKNGKNKKKMD